jgi:putative membrane protein
MTRTRSLAALAAAGVAVVAAAFGAPARADDAEDSKFLQDAIQTDIAEVKLGELALQRSNDDGVRDFAHRLQTDHSGSMQQAAALAKDLGTRIPSAPSDEAQQHYASLAKLSGREFDAAFVNHMVAGHREALAKFGEQTQANPNAAPNAAIAELAAKTLPTLKEHLAMAETLLGTGVGHGAPAAGDGAPHTDPHLRVPPPRL